MNRYRCRRLLFLAVLALIPVGQIPQAGASTPPLPIFEAVEAQPLLAQVKRVVAAMEKLGSPLPAATKAALESASREEDGARAVREVQEALDPHCLLGVGLGAQAPVMVAAGPATPELVEGGWRLFLVKVYNLQGSTGELRAVSASSRSLFNSPAADLEKRWLDMEMFIQPPLVRPLSGLALEYRVLQIYSRFAGERAATISFSLGNGSQEIVFRCLPSAPTTLRVLDESGQPTTAAFVIRDPLGRFYPSLTKRLAPDFAFHPQVYRSDGDVLKLPADVYSIETSRGPEYLARTQSVRLTGEPQTLTFPLQRWIDPSRLGWWSGDHHIHAAGCAHYLRPTEGVQPTDMIRHCLGEDLKVGCALTWGPGFDYQKQFFTGAVADVSRFPYLLRYDIEVSGFGSHQSGHLCLLGLKEQIYPGGASNKHWPTLCLNTLKWAKQQGAICGTAHSGWGLEVKTGDLPNLLVPKFDGIGANEYIVDVTHELPGPDGRPVPAVDFMATVDTPYVWELNMWYHTLNCGYRTRISGETDFPCIYDDRVGVGRSYVKLDGELEFNRWLEGVRAGRSYVGDGRSHLMEFKVGDVAVGENSSELRLAQPGVVRATARVAALLGEQPDPEIRQLPLDQTPYWHLERARLGDSRRVPVEVVVNGVPVARQEILADGQMRDVAFDVPIERSSWVAMRILPSSHTNPVFVLVGGKPVRASRRSAEWCLKGVDQCWSQKKGLIKPAELPDAEQAYEHARESFRRILSESEMD
jgi:hypothetical protein